MQNNKEFRNAVIFGAALTLVAALVCTFLNLWCALIVLLFGSAALLGYIFYTKKRYREIEQLNDYLMRVCMGEYDLDIQDNAEGELSILKNNLYKIILLLRSQNAALQKEKLGLADSLADISHQLKTPLAALTVMTDILKAETDPQNRERFLETIEAQTEKMNWLIVTLLKLSKLDAGTIELEEKPVKIASVVKKAVSPFLITADLRNITLDFSALTDFTFTGDHNWSAEAIGNILKNCLEHTEDGGKIVLSTQETNIYDMLCIADNGCGIPETELPHIFERFYHGESASENSVGIGLALSKTILAREHATIEAKSQVGVGTAFYIKFYKVIV